MREKLFNLRTVATIILALTVLCSIFVMSNNYIYIRGNSMEPVLNNGVYKYAQSDTYSVDDIIVFRLDGRNLVKIIVQDNDDGTYEVASLNNENTYPYIKEIQIKGKIIYDKEV